MSTVTKKFHFATSAEGWVGTPGNGAVQHAWFPPHRGAGNILRNTNTRPSAPLTDYGGCIRTSAVDAPSSENYWEWTGTWEDLGVPSGSTVTNVQGDYLYRFGARHSYFNFSGADAGSGPFELRNSGGTLINTFSSRINCIDRSSFTNWYHPAGGALDPVADIPNGWGSSTGSNLTISHASSTTIKLRLRSLTPPVSGDFKTGNLFRLKQDRVFLTITYTVGSTRRRFISS